VQRSVLSRARGVLVEALERVLISKVNDRGEFRKRVCEEKVSLSIHRLTSTLQNSNPSSDLTVTHGGRVARHVNPSITCMLLVATGDER
jgi:hypothetical protein